jgi:hypothetical protein
MRETSLTDALGRSWIVLDFRVVDGAKRRLPLGDFRAEGRAFQPDGWEGPVMLHKFGYTPYRDTMRKTLLGQLDIAKAATGPAVKPKPPNG